MALKSWGDIPAEDRATIHRAAIKYGRTGKEVYERALKRDGRSWEEFGSPFQRFDELPEEERRAHEQVGLMWGKTGRELWLNLAVNLECHAVRTPSCLGREHIEMLAEFGRAVLSTGWMRHIEDCNFCHGLLFHMERPADPRRVKEFVEEAMRLSEQPTK